MKHICVRCVREGRQDVGRDDERAGAVIRGLCIEHAMVRFEELRRVLVAAG
jgi:hypothetical protein